MMRAGVPTRRYETERELARWRSHLLVAVEVKTGTGRLSVAQVLEREALLDAGGVYVVAGDVVDLVDALTAQGLSVPLLR
jgi:hypothetical protein